MIASHILIIGQCSLQWGRMEFGNIGNFYIVKPMFKNLRRIFPDAVISTTMQFSEDFCKNNNIETLPLEFYYDFDREDNLKIAKAEYEAVATGKGDCLKSPYITAVQNADLVIDFSGDVWGDNADLVGKDRFYCGLYKDLTAQALKPTIMLSCSLGPFSAEKDFSLIEKCLGGFKRIIAREPITGRILEQQGFELDNLVDFPCPSFLFGDDREPISQKPVSDEGNLTIGIALCGWNFERGPFDAWPRSDSEYDMFTQMIENLISKYDARIVLFSHSNGFQLPRVPFELIHGRDFPIMEQLEKILIIEGCERNVKLMDGIYLPEKMYEIVGGFDMLISGRMHGAVAGLSQCVPTVIIDYGHEPKAHKLRGYAEYVDMEHMIANPTNEEDLIAKTEYCVKNLSDIKMQLEGTIPLVKRRAEQQFDYIARLVSELAQEVAK